MQPSRGPPPSTPDTTGAIASAIQNLMAARLGRGFLPLAILFAWGAVGTLRGGSVWVAVGAVLTGASMLAYGLRVVQRALGRAGRGWTALATVGSVVAPVYCLYLIGWLGLRGLTAGGGWSGALAAIGSLALGVWVLRCWTKVVELERLARIMVINPDEEGGAA